MDHHSKKTNSSDNSMFSCITKLLLCLFVIIMFASSTLTIHVAIAEEDVTKETTSETEVYEETLKEVEEIDAEETENFNLSFDIEEMTEDVIYTEEEYNLEKSPDIFDIQGTQVLLSIYTQNKGLISKIGPQSKEACSHFCIGYARALIDGHLYYADPSLYAGASGAQWGDAGFSSSYLSDNTTYKKTILTQLQNGNPVIMHISDGSLYRQGSSSSAKGGHYVLVVGYDSGINTSNPAFSSFYAVDPSDASLITLIDNLSTDRQIVYTNKNNTKPAKSFSRLTVANFLYPNTVLGSGMTASGMLFSTGTITYVDYYVTNTNGTRTSQVPGGSKNPNSNVFCIMSAYDSDALFSQLPNGTYILCLDARDSYGDELAIRKTFTKTNGATTVTKREDISSTTAEYNSITVSNFKYPTHKHTAVSGANTGFFTVEGYLYTPKGSTITYVKMGVKNSSGNDAFTPFTATPNSASYDLHNADDTMSFNSLAAGTYSIYLIAKNTLNQYINVNSTFVVDGNATTTGVYTNSSPYLSQAANVSNLSNTGFKVNLNCKDDNSNLYDAVVTVTNGTTKTYRTTLSGNSGSASPTVSISDFGYRSGTYSISYKIQDANANYVEGTLTTNVPATAVDTVTVSPSSKTVNIGDSFTATATVSPSYARDKTLTWSTSNSAVATVSKTGDTTATITAKGAGTATITATSSNGKKGTCTVTVSNPSVPIDSVTLNRGQLRLATNCNYTFVATISPSNTTDSKTLTWTSSNPAVATINSNGVVTGVAPGTTNITVTTSNNKTATCPVQVYDSVVADGVWMPGNVKKGEVWNIGGNLFSPSNITDAQVFVSDLSGNTLLHYSATPNSKYWQVQDAAETIALHTLALGTYKIRLYVANQNRQLIDYTHEFTVTNDAKTNILYYNGSPIITSVTILNVNQDGFDVDLVAKDRDGNLKGVYIATWTGTWEYEYRDDIKEYETTVSGSDISIRWHVDIKDHNCESGPYWIDYKVYDADGNWAWNGAPAEVPETVSDYIRIYRSSRLEESIKTADEIKSILGISKFDNIIVAKDSDFADALSGSYLAAKKEAPILLVGSSGFNNAYNYIYNNLSSGGTVYILGSENAVPASFEGGLNSGINVKRLYGSSRYMTNLEILKEAGMTSTGDIIVVTGSGYADSLSAGAVGLPIIMVDNGNTKLKNSQKKFLEANVEGQIYIMGDTEAVNASLEKELKVYGPVKRIGGTSRWDTTKLIAEEFFSYPSHVVLATGNDFADGLIASPLAYTLHSPLLLCASNKVSWGKTYVRNNNITKAYIIGSKDYINDVGARKILGIDESVVILEK